MTVEKESAQPAGGADNYYEILGLAPDASLDDIAS